MDCGVTKICVIYVQFKWSISEIIALTEPSLFITITVTEPKLGISSGSLKKPVPTLKPEKTSSRGLHHAKIILEFWLFHYEIILQINEMMFWFLIGQGNESFL